MEFSTKDRANGKNLGSCAVFHTSAWWFNNCQTSDLNGVYFHNESVGCGRGVLWAHWRGYNYSLKETEMKIRSH